MPEIITSRENSKIKHLCKLVKSTSFRKETQLFIAEGYKLCKDICAVIKPTEVYYTQVVQDKYNDISFFEGTHYLISDNVSEKISDVQSPQGLFCVFPMPCDLDVTLDDTTRMIVLDNVQDPSNIGAILRTATAFGFSAVLVSAGCADVYSPKSLRSAMSSTVKIPVVKTDCLADTIKEFQAKGVTFLAARLENSQSIHDICPTGAVAIVIGNEGVGICQEVAEICDYSVNIPIQKDLESLNAAVAAGILIWNYRNK